MKQLQFALISIFVILTIVFCSGCTQYGDAAGTNERKYDCDYHTLSLNTEISTVINNETVTISGRFLTFLTDPLKMTDSTGKTIATADDSYHIVNQDDHNIIVNGKFEVCVAGNFELLGESYNLYDKNKNKIGYAEFGAFGCSGGVYDKNGNIAAKFDSPPLMNDYTVTIYDNNICSDTAMLLIIASYVSDYHYDND